MTASVVWPLVASSVSPTLMFLVMIVPSIGAVMV